MHKWIQLALEIQQTELQIDELYAARGRLKQQQKQLYQAIRDEAGRTGKTFEDLINQKTESEE